MGDHHESQSKVLWASLSFLLHCHFADDQFLEGNVNEIINIVGNFSGRYFDCSSRKTYLIFVLGVFMHFFAQECRMLIFLLVT